MVQFKLSKKRNLKGYCPCGKSNKDGKFVEFDGYSKHGYCHSCCKTFLPDTETIVEPFVSKIENKYTIPTSTYSLELVEKTKMDNHISNFIKFIRTIFSDKTIIDAINLYQIGTWEGDKVIFWEIDQSGKVYHGKVMGYDPETGKRSYSQSGKPNLTSMRVCLKLWNFKDERCLFGLHLINKNTKIVALVESAKTAFIMKMFKPEFEWLATGDKGRFNCKLLKEIKHCKIIAFPDKGEYSDWLRIANELNKSGFNIIIDDTIENMDYPKGTDLADVYIELKKNESFQYWHPKKDSEFSEGSRDVYRMFQESKNPRLELSKEESYKAIQFLIENNTDTFTYRVLH